MGKVTLKEIAEISGVSVSTVSRILSGDTSRKTSEETASRVEDPFRRGQGDREA